MRVNQLKASLAETKDKRDAYKERAHSAEEALRQCQRAAETEINRCTHYLNAALQTLPEELQRFSKSFADVSPVIDIADDMIWSSNAQIYFRAGIDAMRLVAKACDDHLPAAPQTVLDLPCGHGRVMRWLRQAYPEAQLLGCDTQRNGMEFCQRSFGSGIIEPADKPSQMATPQTADVIWIGSLFTHLPETEFVAFLKHLPNLLNEGGIVVFTTHGEEAMNRLQRGREFHLQNVDQPAIEKAHNETGFAYAPYKKTQDYGVSFSTREFIEQHIDSIPGFKNHLESADLWCGFQDVFVCQKVG